MAQKFFVGLAFTGQTNDIIHFQNIFQQVALHCNINKVTLLSKIEGANLLGNINEHFDFISTEDTPTKFVGSASDLFIFYQLNSDEIPEEIQPNIICFYNNFKDKIIEGFGVSKDFFKENFVLVKVKVWGDFKRNIIPFIDITQENESVKEPTAYQQNDCSAENAQIRKLTEEKNRLLERLERMNAEKINFQREKNDCDDALKSLQQENDRIISKLDDMREKSSRFSSKDPQQIANNIKFLQEELLKIQREAEAERQRQEAEEAERQRQEAEEAERQRREAERQRQEAEAERQRQEAEAERQRQEAEAERQRQADAERQRQRQRQEAEEAQRPRQSASNDTNCMSKDKEPVRCTSRGHYKKQSLIFHPDKNSSCIEEATEKFQRLMNMCEHVNVGGKKTIKNKSKKINKLIKKQKTKKSRKSRKLKPRKSSKRH